MKCLSARPEFKLHICTKPHFFDRTFALKQHFSYRTFATKPHFSYRTYASNEQEPHIKND